MLTDALRRPSTWSATALEVRSLGRCVARYPLGLADEPVRASRRGVDPTHPPVVLVHGYAHNRSGWYVLDRHLRRAGFTDISTLNYNPMTADVPQLADRLARRVDDVRRLTGADRVHLVGHSLGGIILRWYVQERGGHDAVHTAVTIASPHEGTVPARLWFGRTARQLRPGSWVLRRLDASAAPGEVRWVAFYSNLDVLVQPARSAMLRNPVLAAENVLVKDHGHLSAMVSPRVAREVVAALTIS